MRKVLSFLFIVALLSILGSCSTPKETSEIVEGEIIAIIEFEEPLDNTYIVSISTGFLTSTNYEIEEIKSGLEIAKGDIVLVKLYYLDGEFIGGEILSKEK